MPQDDKVRVRLEGVPETLLWSLYNRAAQARLTGGLLHDPLAVKVLDSIDFPFARRFGKPVQGHVMRARCFDAEIRDFLAEHPDGTVVGLAEGLETQFWRVDNGTVTWLAVDLPESAAVRRRLLQDAGRHRSLARSALDFSWMDEVDPARGVLITAAGLLMYLEPPDVRRLIAACAGRFPGGTMLFDTIPRWYSRRTLQGMDKTEEFRLPPMPWGLDVSEQGSLKAFHPNIREVTDLDVGRGHGLKYGYVIPTLRRLPWFGNRMAAFVRLRFGPGC